jgi:tyrosine-protein kinase Etk/Wzc
MQNGNWNQPQDRYTEVSADFDVKQILKVILSRWYWIVGALVLAVGGCFIFLQIAHPRYVAEMVLKYNDKQTELDELNRLIQPDAANQEYLTERYVIKSEEVINGAIKKLNYPFTFYRELTFRRDDVYPYQPFTSQIISYDPNKFRFGLFEIKKSGQITYKTEDETENISFDLSKDTLVSVQGLAFSVKFVERLTQDYLFTYNDINDLRGRLDGPIKVKEEEANLPILNVSFTYYNQQFTQDFLQKLIESYEEYNLGQKKRSSNLTINFIQDQIKIYASALQKASSELERYKQRSSVPSLQASMTDVMGQMAQFETQRNTLEIEKSYINLLEQSLSNRFEPVNVGSIGLDGTSDGMLLKLVNDLNRLILDRKAYIIGKNLSVNNPIVKAADDEITRVREQIVANIKVQRQKNESTLRIINQNLSLLKNRMNALPSVERELGYLQNDRDVNEKIYLLLINKEIETSIVKAGVLPSFTVLTRAFAYQIYPQGARLLTVSLVLGLLIGVGSIFLARFANNKFTEITKIGSSERVNLLGLIQRFPHKISQNEKDLLHFLENRSLFSESINSIRTNLSFLTDTPSSQGKLLVITSELSGEGKSFLTLNLATSLTKIGKKVLVVVSDLRRSNMHRFFNHNNKVGLSTYLSGKVEDYHQTIHHSVIENLDFIAAGPSPFNPTELIQNERFERFIEHAQQEYDFVLVDTAPVGLVSDNVPLLKKSDLVVYIIRWLYSHKESYLLVNQIAEEYKIKNVGVIINDFYKDDLYANLMPAAYYSSKGYGYKQTYDYYGKKNNYYHNESPSRSFWKKMTGWVKKGK